jgi:hypothetical protein
MHVDHGQLVDKVLRATIVQCDVPVDYFFFQQDLMPEIFWLRFRQS